MTEKQVYSTPVPVLYIVILAFSFSAEGSNIIAQHPGLLGSCTERVSVEDVVVIDVPYRSNCTLEIETQKDRILVFTVTGANVEYARDFLTISETVNGEDVSLLAETQHILDLQRKDLPSSVTFSTQSSVTIRFKKLPLPDSGFQLKMQKAVNCPANLGSNSECKRVVDEVSCYCALFTLKTRPDHKAFCEQNGMLLLSLETALEEQLIKKTWGEDKMFWTSLTDAGIEGFWKWEATATDLFPGYGNWGPGQPDNSNGNEHCMHLNLRKAWNDLPCTSANPAICEAQP